MKIIYTKHAEEMLKFRNIERSLVNECIDKPDQILPARDGKKIYLKDFGTNYLKVIVDEEENYIVVVTLYWLAKKRIKT